MWWRLSIPLLGLPLVLFARLAAFYATPQAVVFTLLVVLVVLCCVTASMMWCLGGEASEAREINE